MMQIADCGIARRVAAPLSAQSLLYRSPNLGGTWTPDPGVVQINFAHRFCAFPGPSHTVVDCGRGGGVDWRASGSGVIR